MSNTLYIINIIDSVLKNWSVKINRDEIRYILCSTPSFPSIKAVHDTLAYFGLYSNVYQAEFMHIKDKPHCIVHTNKDGGHFFYIKEIDEDSVCLYDGNSFIITKDEFLCQWDGIVLIVEDKNTLYTPSYHKNRGKQIFTLFISLFLMSIPMLWNSYEEVAQLIFDTIGLILSYMLFTQSVFGYQEIPLCHFGSHFDCSVVSKSNPFKSITPFSLPVIGLFFFIFDWIILLLGAFHNVYILYIYLLAVVCMVILTIYQILIIKKYCLYCLCISTIVFVKPFFLSISNNNDWMIFFPIFFAAMISIVVTTFINEILKMIKAKTDSALNLLTIKRIPFIFDMLLRKNPPIKAPKDYALVFGNENSPIILDTIISLNCPLCKRLVKEICILIERWPTSFCWKVYIKGIYEKGKNESECIMQLNVVEQYLKSRDYAFCILKEWNFNDNCDILSSETCDLYANIVENIRQMGVEYYPTILFNNHPFPVEYEISDIGILISDRVQNSYSIK